MIDCLILARAETHNGALDWFNTPINDLAEWGDAVEELNRRIKKRSK